ncbi:RNA-directed DNA polymerase, eukaryota, Reverse transcriptase zinc-binding domain protein [Artemisia annua]|uniref:RNA-directed DNA polymerase, eukaryota, Reverse transcriptase zinc-binding domain protein n=1 Tax=Artemisia annua TaxID=35608 RepID=A0A2U1LYI8_ARTAN|nr:RNA-directed DNA polymerase, eukaryota, Reverse transcriptase zinc-binding domain protein [Artemisia annua]
MENPNSLNPNFGVIGSDEGIAPKRTTRSQIGCMKGANKQPRVSNKDIHVCFQKGDLNLGIKGGRAKKRNKDRNGNEGGCDAGDGVEEEFDGDMGSSVDTQSVDSRSFGESASEKDVEGFNENVVSANTDIHVPVDENPLLSSMGSPTRSPRLLKRGEVLEENGNIASASFSFNNQEKWPSLNKVNNVPSVAVNEKTTAVVHDVNVNMASSSVGVKQVVSFASVVQGLSPSGCNKLKLVPKANGRANFARVLVEVDANNGYVENVDVCYKSLGKTMKLKVEYPWKPPICDTCKVFGHGNENCVNKIVSNADNKKVETNNQAGNDRAQNVGHKNDDWKTVDNKRNAKTSVGANEPVEYSVRQNNIGGGNSYNRGGFGGRGRGGDVGTSDNLKKVDVNDKGKSVMTSKENGQGKGANEKVQQVVSPNRYAALYEENEDVGNDVDKAIMNRINEVCHLCKTNNESHNHLFFACPYSKRLWERLKPLSCLDDIGNDWPYVISGIVNKPASNKIWSIIQRLVFGAAVYFIWQERNVRRAQFVETIEDCLFKIVVDTVRLKLMSLSMKYTTDVAKAAGMWKFKLLCWVAGYVLDWCMLSVWPRILRWIEVAGWSLFHLMDSEVFWVGLLGCKGHKDRKPTMAVKKHCCIIMPSGPCLVKLRKRAVNHHRALELCKSEKQFPKTFCRLK